MQLAVLLHSQHFRCHESNCSEGTPNHVVVCLKELTHAKIAEIELSEIVKHDVFGFDISMREILDCVAVVKG